jgi:spermidine synthase
MVEVSRRRGGVLAFEIGPREKKLSARPETRLTEPGNRSAIRALLARIMRETQRSDSPAPAPAWPSSPEAAPADAQRRLERFLLLAFFVSGATGLIFEVVWTRQLVLVFGATSLAVSSVLAAYMAGLGLGGVLGGRLAERITRPLVVYGLLEGAVAIYGLAVPLIFRGLEPLYRALHHAYAPNFLTFSALRFVVVFFALLMPTTLMGATLPVLARFAAQRGRRADVGVSRLYAANTFGAVAGTLLAGFVLLERLGLFRANLCAAGAGLLLCAGVVLLARRLPVAKAATASEPGTEAGLLPADADDDDDAHLGRFIAFGFAVSGAASMINEVVWTRALVLLIGPSTYAFSVMLATFLAGLALGSALGAWRAPRLARPVLWLGIIEVLAAGTTLLALGAFEPMESIYRAFSGAEAGGRGPLALGVKALTAAALLMPTAICFGASFPLAAAAYARGKSLASRVGELYGANTLGCIVGSLAAGFFLVPRLGLEPALTIAATLNLAIGVLFYLRQHDLSSGLRLAGLVAFGIFGLAMVTHGPRWDPAYLAAGVRSGPNALVEVVFNEPGYNATISVTRAHVQHVPNLSLRTDGKPDASDIGDLDTQVQIGLVPLLLHPDPQDVLVVGFASGTTCGAVLKDPRVKRMDVLEIERAMVHASHLFDHMNGRPLEDPRTHLIETDARNHYRVSEQKYDVIVSEPSNPWLSGPSHLFTQEAFGEAHGLLKPGGIMIQWMQGYSLHPDTAATILAAFRQAFPHVRIFSIPQANDFMIVGSDRAIPLDLAAIDARARQPAVAQELSRTGVQGALDLIAEEVGDQGSVDLLTAGHPANSDDNGYVEFHAPKDKNQAQQLASWLSKPYAGPYDELLAGGMSPEEIGGQMGFRVALFEELEMAPAMRRWLSAHQAQAAADRLDDAIFLRAPRAPPQTKWQALLARTALWLASRPQPVRFEGIAESFETPREGAFLSAMATGTEELTGADPLFRFVRLRKAAERGECARLDAQWTDIVGMREQATPVGLALTAANAHETATALARCGRAVEADAFSGLEHRTRTNLASFMLFAEGAAPEEALGIDPENQAALLRLASARCKAGDVAGEVAALTRIVATDAWRTGPAARLAFLARDRPASDLARAAALHAVPYFLPGEPHQLEGCLDAPP